MQITLKHLRVVELLQFFSCFWTASIRLRIIIVNVMFKTFELSFLAISCSSYFLVIYNQRVKVLDQMPSAFEFNDYYLRFLAYHSAAGCFRTFLLDSEAERIKCDSLSGTEDDMLAASVWVYIEKKREKYNFGHFSIVYLVAFL